jgi:tRNA threonylcarbamoyl adenosine modification protein YeaZ
VLLLAFDTATPAVTAAVCTSAGEALTVLAEESNVDARRHGELLAPSIRSVVSRAGASMADLTHIAVGIGPGPYTGLRVGLACAHALRDALGIPCHGVFTLDAVAKTSGRGGEFVAVTDARRKEVFWARYADADTRVGEVALGDPLEVAGLGLPVVGPGAEQYPEAFAEVVADPRPCHPTAAALGEVALRALAGGTALPEAWPHYLRRPDASPPGSPKRVRQWQHR